MVYTGFCNSLYFLPNRKINYENFFVLSKYNEMHRGKPGEFSQIEHTCIV